MPRRYAMIGTGALGGYYGARLHHAGCEMHFLLHGDVEYVQHHGLTVESPEGDFSIPPDAIHAHARPAGMPKCDVVCVCLKTTHNHLLAELVPPVLAEGGVVLMLQNGLGIEKPLADLVGPQCVMAGLCFLCSNKIGPGHIRHSDYGQIKLGEYRPDGSPGGITDRMKDIAGDLDKAGIPHALVDDLLLARWQKLVWNVPYNGLSVALDATTDLIMQDPRTAALAESLMWEVVNGAKACGRTIEPSFVTKMLTDTVKMTPYRTSMKIDFDEERPLELEAIFANPIKAAQQQGVYLPRMEMLYQQLCFMDRRNRG